MLPLPLLLLLGTGMSAVGYVALKGRGEEKGEDPTARVPPWRQLPDQSGAEFALGGDEGDEGERGGSDAPAELLEDFGTDTPMGKLGSVLRTIERDPERPVDPAAQARAAEVEALLGTDALRPSGTSASTSLDAWALHAERGYEDMATWLSGQARSLDSFHRLVGYFDEVRAQMECSHGDVAVLALRVLSEDSALKDHAWGLALEEHVVAPEGEMMFRSMWRMAVERLPVLPVGEAPGFGGVFGYDRTKPSKVRRSAVPAGRRRQEALERIRTTRPERPRVDMVPVLRPELELDAEVDVNEARAEPEALVSPEKWPVPGAEIMSSVEVDEGLRRRPAKVWRR